MNGKRIEATDHSFLHNVGDEQPFFFQFFKVSVTG